MLNLDRFDRIVFAIIGAVVGAIGLVVLIGNNVGVQVESYSPETTARSDSRIRIRFYNEMARASVEQNFSISPAVEGSLRWNGDRELVFEPSSALLSGQTYTVLVKEGAKAKSGGAELKADLRFSFRVALPRAVYLAPASAQDRNLYVFDLNTGEVQQLTDYDLGIADYEVAPDGQSIAYTLYKEDGTSDLWLYHLDSGAINQLTNCVNASCAAPSWKPDGTEIAYERNEYDPAFGGAGAVRVWVVDVQTVQSRLLFEDTQLTGHSAQYSPSGNKIAIFSTNPPGILIYDFISQGRILVENLQGVVGDFSPDGKRLLYPVLVRGAVGSTFYTQLEMLDFDKNQRSAVTGSPEDPIEDTSGYWRPLHPNQLAVTRRYLDDRYTDGPQVYLLDIATNEATPLIVDGAYNHGFLRWSPDGNLLLMQRFNRVEQGARPQIWLYDLQTQELRLIADDAFLPEFLP